MGRRKPVWIRWFPKDALDGMAQLAPLEELAYRRILDLIITTGDALLDEDRALAWMTKTGRQWPAIKRRLVELGKIAAEGGFIRNARASESCVETERFVAQKSEAGKSSASKRKSLKTQETRSTGVAAGVAAGVATGASTERQPSNSQHSSDSSLRSESAPPAAGAPERRPVQQAMVLPIAGGGEPVPDGESLGERVRREQGGEARAILRRLAPALAPDRMGTLLGTWCKHLEGDRALLLHVLRDAERAAASERIVGDPIRWLWGLVRQRASATNHSGTPNEQFGRPAERRTYCGGGSAENRAAVLAAFPELAARMEGD